MPNNQYDMQGMLAQYGLNIDPEKMKLEQLERRQSEAMQLVGNLGLRGTSAGIAQMAGLLGARFGNSSYQPPEQEQRKAEVVAEASQRMTEWMAANPDATPADIALVYHRAIAASALDKGLTDVAAKAFETFATKKEEKQRRELELESLGYKLRSERVVDSLVEDDAKNTKLRWGLDRYVTVWPQGSQDVTEAVDLEREIDEAGNPTGNLIDKDGKVVFQQGEYTTHAPPVGGGGGGRSGSERRYNPSDMQKLRDQQTASIEMMAGVTKIDDIIQSGLKRDGTVDSLGWGGALAGKATEIADNVSSMMRNVSKALGVEDGSVVATKIDKKGKAQEFDLRDQARIIELYGEEKIDEYIPKKLRRTGQDAIRIRQNLLAVAYAIMRAKSPGEARYSDTDYKIALQLAGEGLADPNKLRATLYDRVQESLLSYDIAKTQAGEEAEDIWGAGLKLHKAARDKFEQRFGGYKVGGSGNEPAQSNTDLYPGTTIDAGDGWSFSIRQK